MKQEIRCPKDNLRLATIEFTGNGGLSIDGQMEDGKRGQFEQEPDGTGLQNVLAICPKCGTKVLCGSMPGRP